MKKTLPGCPVTNAMNVMGGRWRGVIAYYLLQAEGHTLRFSELRRAIPRITQRVLTQDLRELESAKVLTRKVYACVPARVDYTLTARGRALQPVIEALRHWGAELDKPAPRTASDRSQKSTRSVAKRVVAATVK